MGGKLKKHILLLVLSFISAAILINFTGEKTEYALRKVFSGSGLNSQKIIIDTAGIPTVDYGFVGTHNIGKQINPTVVSQVALDYYEKLEKGDTTKRRLFLNCANWLVNHSVDYGDYRILEYNYPWPVYGATPPWRSALAQAQAIQVMIRAHKLTNKSIYLETSRKLLRSFFHDVSKGGVTYKTPNGWWYEEYVGSKKPRVLNGMMFALLGIYDYYRYTKDPDAEYLFGKGVQALKNKLPEYDDDGYSYYDALKHPASPGYHKIHVQLLEELYQITHEKLFKEYHDRWSNAKRPPFLKELMKGPLTKMEIAVFLTNFLFLLVVFEILAIFVENNRLIRFFLKVYESFKIIR